MSKELRSRLLVAAVGIPFGFFMAYQGGWLLAVVLAGVAALGAHEFYTLASAKAGKPLGWFGIPTSALLVLVAAWEPTFPAWGDRALALLLFLGLITSAAVIFNRNFQEGPLFSAAATVSGALYTGGTLAFAVFLRELPEMRGTVPPEPWEGALLMLFPLWVTWSGDSAAYFVGKRFGRRKLAPKVSPGKTVEGGLAGVVGSVVAGALAGLLLGSFENFPVGPVAGGLIGVALSVAGQLGDLAESVLKREAGVKDSGTLLPGHGGALDRFDALFFTVPLTYGLVLLVQVLR
ncbi:MAG: phosphatidate cytidylyltransferase [Gemmatimonadetes bacterium]|nr:phosphatidate cytidylyltransferase [Gemmatimonadota bacterium]